MILLLLLLLLMPLRQFFAGASGPEPFSGGRPVKSILPHIVKGQHRGTRLEKYKLCKQQKGSLGTLHAGVSIVVHYLEHSQKHALNVE